MRPSEPLGTILGAALSPVVALVALFRRARVFHPSGWCYQGEVKPIAASGDAAAAAQRLAGGALVRFSTGKLKSIGGPDLFGCAIRFCDVGASTHDAGARDQDLLMASFHGLKRVDAGIRDTDNGDFLRNTYYANADFEDADLGLTEWRCVPEPNAADSEEDGAVARMQRAVEQGACLHIEAKPANGTWTPIVDVVLSQQLEIDQHKLRFSPFRSGRGIEPVGWLNAARRLVYPAGAFGRGS